MPWEWAMGQFVTFTVVLARTGGLFLFGPVLASEHVPRQVRLALAAALALVVVPNVGAQPVELPETLIGYAAVLTAELGIGVALGYGMVLVFGGAQMAGQAVSQQLGVSMGGIINPDFDEGGTAAGELYFLLASLVFLLVGGHRALVEILLHTFRVIPPGQGAFEGPVIETLVALAGESFSAAVRLAAPVVVALVASEVAIGLLGRTVPQMNVLVVGFPIRNLLAVAVLLLSLGGASVLLRDEISAAAEALRSAWLP